MPFSAMIQMNYHQRGQFPGIDGGNKFIVLATLAGSFHHSQPGGNNRGKGTGKQCLYQVWCFFGAAV